jgi:hypothetical protein
MRQVRTSGANITDMTRHAPRPRSALATAISLTAFFLSSFVSTAFAEQATQNGQRIQSDTSYHLPGVKAAKPIVSTPQAEPNSNTITTFPDGSFMVGNTRVKISGAVTVDIGAGQTPQKRD